MLSLSRESWHDHSWRWIFDVINDRNTNKFNLFWAIANKRVWSLQMLELSWQILLLGICPHITINNKRYSIPHELHEAPPIQNLQQIHHTWTTLSDAFVCGSDQFYDVQNELGCDMKIQLFGGGDIERTHTDCVTIPCVWIITRFLARCTDAFIGIAKCKMNLLPQTSQWRMGGFSSWKCRRILELLTKSTSRSRICTPSSTSPATCDLSRFDWKRISTIPWMLPLCLTLPLDNTSPHSPAARTAPTGKTHPPTVLAAPPHQAGPHRPTSGRTGTLQLPHSWCEYSGSVERCAQCTPFRRNDRAQGGCDWRLLRQILEKTSFYEISPNKDTKNADAWARNHFSGRLRKRNASLIDTYLCKWWHDIRGNLAIISKNLSASNW